MNNSIENSVDSRDSLFDEVAREIISREANNNIDFDSYPIFGDAEEIKKVIHAFGSVNIGIRDVIDTLSFTNSNYITTGFGSGRMRLLTALKQAIDRLPVSIDDIDKILLNVWTEPSRPIGMPAIKDMVNRLNKRIPAINLMWGIAWNNELSENEIKVTLLAVNKHRLC